MKQKINPPKRKMYNRNTRLLMGQRWLASYSGKHVVSSYAKWFGVDKLYAVSELRILGVEVSQEYEALLGETVRHLTSVRTARIQEELANTIESEEQTHGFAFIAGYTSGGFPYGLTLKELQEIEKSDSVGSREEAESGSERD